MPCLLRYPDPTANKLQYHYSALAQQIPPANALIICRTPYPGGAPANVAAALGKLGAKVALITAFGNDQLAKDMRSLLEG